MAERIEFQDLKTTNGPQMDQLVAAAERVLRSGRYINGPEVKAFENELAAETGSKYCVAVSNGLDALRLILKAYIVKGILKEGDEVIIPANTFIATFLAATSCGLKPVPADIDESTFCLDFDKLPLTDSTRALIAVHLYGLPCYNKKAYDALKARGVVVIEDNAQALGASVEGKNTGSLADAAAISFYPAKNIGACGDAGAVLTDNEDLARTVRMLANYGASEKYYHILPGCNCRMDEIQAALLRVKLPLIRKIIEDRNRRAALYDAMITSEAVIKPWLPPSDTVHAWHQYVIRHPWRDDLRKYLEIHGIGTEIHYPVPCHLQECYRAEAWDPLPAAERSAKEILSLPIADVTDKEIERTATLINEFKE